MGYIHVHVGFVPSGLPWVQPMVNEVAALQATGCILSGCGDFFDTHMMGFIRDHGVLSLRDYHGLYPCTCGFCPFGTTMGTTHG